MLREKIKSGNAYLYREGGVQSTVIETRMKDVIDKRCLRYALEKALKRFPYMSSKLYEENGDFYLEKNDAKIIVEERMALKSLGGYENNYHLIDVSFYGKTIFLSFHHGLCDGEGIKPFLKTILYYYCRVKYEEFYEVDGIRCENDEMLEGELIDPLNLGKFEVDENKKLNLSRDGYEIPEIDMKIKDEFNFRYEIKIKEEDLIKCFKENNASPAVGIALLMSKAIKNVNKDANKDIICNMASNMRHEIKCDNTFKNCVRSLILPYSKEMEDKTFKENATKYREIIKLQREENEVKAAFNSQVSLVEKLDEFNSFESKKGMMTFFENIKLNTFILSYLGKIDIGEYNKYIEEYHLYSSGTKGITLNMVASEKYITVDLLQSFNDDAYIIKFIEELDTLNIKYEAISKVKYKTPRCPIKINSNLKISI